MARRLPHLVFIDDRPDQTESSRGPELAGVARVSYMAPDDVTIATIKAADLVLVDYDLSDWQRPEVDAVDSVLLPRDGLALIGILRGWAERGQSVDRVIGSVPTAFALHTGQLDRLPGGENVQGREYVLADAHGIEWVFTKSSSRHTPTFSSQVVSLANAARKVTEEWPPRSAAAAAAKNAALSLLRHSDSATWSDEALREFEACHPPLGDTSSSTRGLTFLRWFLHRILPYPSFVLDDRYLAARLYVTPRSFRKVLSKRNSRVRELLRPAKYGGIASDFLGSRWWRAGVEAIIWKLTEGQLTSRDATTNALLEIDSDLRVAEPLHPVVSLNESLIPTDTLTDADTALEIQPDHWPPYAQRAWVTTELIADHRHLKSLLVTEAGVEGN